MSTPRRRAANPSASSVATHVYLTCCVDSTADKINALVESAVPVSYRTFRRHCDPGECGAFAHYETDPRNGLTLKNDGMVYYYRGTYRGVPCYFVDHSRIEYIWVPAAEAERLRKDGEADRHAKAAKGVPGGRGYACRVERLSRSWLA